MLYLNREVTTDVSIPLSLLSATIFSSSFLLSFSLSPALNCFLKEYEKCYELIHNTVPHAKSIPSNPNSGESLRSFALFPPSLATFKNLTPFSIRQAKLSPK
jgi:hypothetical protein